MNQVEQLVLNTKKYRQYEYRLAKGSFEERYHTLKQYCNGFVTLKALKRLNINLQAKVELKNVSIDQLKGLFEQLANKHHIQARTANYMWKILSMFYHVCAESLSGMCHPSMETMAYTLEPELEPIKKTDSAFEKICKTRKLSQIKMRISRSVKRLQRLGLIAILPYYIDRNHFKDNKKKACFAYALYPISQVFHLPAVQTELPSLTLSEMVQYLFQLTKEAHSNFIYQFQKIRGHFKPLIKY